MNSPAPAAKPSPESSVARPQVPRFFLDYDYFKIAESLANSYGYAGRAVMKQFGLVKEQA